MSEPASVPVLEAHGLCKAYAGVRRRIEVLRGLDLGVAAGEAIAVIGDSGVGKSTLLHLLGGLDRADAGTLRFAKLDLLSLSGAALAEYRNRSVGFVFQFHHLLPEFTALENVEMPFRIGRHKGGGTEQARATLARLGLAERLDHRPAALSGGEQQRVAIARALAPRPALVLADEPTGNLDPNSARAVFELLREVQGERGFAMVLATHSSRLAHACDRVLRLEEGVLRPLDEAETARYFEAT